MATNALKWYSTTDGNKKVAINLDTAAAEPSENLYVNGSANITGKISANQMELAGAGSVSVDTSTWLAVDSSDSTKLNINIPTVLVVSVS